MSQCQKDGIQKCLLPINGKPILYYVVEALRRQGIEKIYLLANHLSQQIIDFVESNYKGVFTKVDVEVIKVKSLGTADALLNLKKEISEPFIYTNGDIAFPPSLIEKLYENHTSEYFATMAFSSILLASTHPYCDIDRNNGTKKMLGFEFPTKETPHTFNLCSMETMILSPDIFNYLPFVDGHMVVKAVDYAWRDGQRVNIIECNNDWVHLEVDGDIAFSESKEFLKLYEV
jgi:NDP-sugar pyrophosphorylase family protein